jgi:hypothetical protein
MPSLLSRFRRVADDLLRMVGVWALVTGILSAVGAGLWAYAWSLPLPVMAVMVLAVFAQVLNIAVAIKWLRDAYTIPSRPPEAEESVLLPLVKARQEIQKPHASQPLLLTSETYGKPLYSSAQLEAVARQLDKSPANVLGDVVLNAVLEVLDEHLRRQPGKRDSLGRLLEALLPSCIGDPANAGQLLKFVVESEYLHAVAPPSTGRFELSQKAYNRIATGR